MTMYNWQKKEWPRFTFSLEEADDTLLKIVEKAGLLKGMFKVVSAEIQTETLIDLMVSEAIKTSEIEGELLSRLDVISSVRKNMGLPVEITARDKRAQGIGSLMIQVRNSFAEPLTEKMLFDWHSLLLGYRNDIETGKWRSQQEPMQVISGTIGKIKVHFEAPPSERVSLEMHEFINWFNETSPGEKAEIKMAPVRSAIAHLYFETIHPFEDGNGRIGRALAEKALSQGFGQPVLLSLSKAIERVKKTYYSELEKAQSSLEISSWINFFVDTISDAQTDAQTEIEFTLKKVKFFDKFKQMLNERQLKVINRMLEEGTKGFEGGMNAGKYAAISKVSKATATRDLQYLSELKVFRVNGAGRSTIYQINLD